MNLKSECVKKFLFIVRSNVGKVICGFLIILVGIWVPACLYGLRSWTSVPSVLSGIVTVILGCIVLAKGVIDGLE